MIRWFLMLAIFGYLNVEGILLVKVPPPFQEKNVVGKSSPISTRERGWTSELVERKYPINIQCFHAPTLVIWILSIHRSKNSGNPTKQINKLTLLIDLFTFYTQICLCHLLAVSPHLFTHWAAGTFFNLRPFRFRDKSIVSSADSDTSHVGRFRGCMWTAGAHIPEFPPTNRKKMSLRKSTFKGRTWMSRWVDIYSYWTWGFPSQPFLGMCIFGRSSDHQGGLHCSFCGNLKSNLNGPEFGASEGIRPWQFRIVVGWFPNPAEKYVLVKLERISPGIGVKIKDIWVATT